MVYLLMKYNPDTSQYLQIGEACSSQEELEALAINEGEGVYFKATVHDSQLTVRPPRRKSGLVVENYNPNPKPRKKNQ